MVIGGNFMMTWLNKIKERFDGFLYVFFGVVYYSFVVFWFYLIIYLIINPLYLY